MILKNYRFGKNPIVIGRIFPLLLLILGLVSAFFLRSKWKTTALLTLLMILVPVISYEYTLIFMFIPLIMFLDREEKEPLDYLYLACFILIFVPFTLGKIDIINNGFKRSTALPLTYGLLIQNVAISIMATCLIIQGIARSKNILVSRKKSILAVRSRILGVNKAHSNRRRRT